jgi:hypothetical protein
MIVYDQTHLNGAAVSACRFPARGEAPRSGGGVVVQAPYPDEMSAEQRTPKLPFPLLSRLLAKLYATARVSSFLAWLLQTQL